MVMKGADPKETGISKITGRRLTVRHALEADLVFIRQSLKGKALTDWREFVVACMDSRIIAFGRLKREQDVYVAEVFQSRKSKDIERLIVEHLIHNAPHGAVILMKKKEAYLKELGFKLIPKSFAGSALMVYFRV